MNATFELWDYTTGNCIGAYDSEAAALADVCETIQRYGDDAAMPLVLLAAPDHGEAERIAAGRELVNRARATKSYATKSGD